MRGERAIRERMNGGDVKGVDEEMSAGGGGLRVGPARCGALGEFQRGALASEFDPTENDAVALRGELRFRAVGAGGRRQRVDLQGCGGVCS